MQWKTYYTCPYLFPRSIDKNSDFTGVRISSASAASDFPSGACSETFHAYPFWMQDDASCCLGIPSCHFMVGDFPSQNNLSARHFLVVYLLVVVVPGVSLYYCPF